MARLHIPLLVQLIRAFVKGPETVAFPFGPAEIPSGFRGRVIINEENCKGCSLCVRDCPAGALELTRSSKNNYQLIYHPDHCAYCGQCELSCNFDAIHLVPTYIEATFDRDSLRVILVNRHTDTD